MNTQQKPKRSLYEDQPFWSSCFKPRNPLSKSAYVGVIALEDGKRYWVNVYERQTRTGNHYVAIHLEPKDNPQDSLS
jgi:hypothetical protein